MPEDSSTHRTAAGGVSLTPVRLSEVRGWIAPWLGHGLLVAAGIFGLSTASGAPDDATYDAGMITFALAVLILAIRLKRQLDGDELGLLLPVSVGREDGLILSIALLTVLGLGGAIVAATTGGIFYGVGLALFIISAALIFHEIKQYFDRNEGRS
jgi:hypothetical protein